MAVISIAEFMDRVAVDSEGDCWLWQGGINQRWGYGRIRVGERCYSAHRVSWQLFRGEIPEGEGWHGTCVLHKCDVRRCVNPNHLFLGTQRQNIEDCHAKNRHIHGETAPARVLNNEAVRMIRFIWEERLLSQSEMGRICGVGVQCINKVVRGRTWLAVAA